MNKQLLPEIITGSRIELQRHDIKMLYLMSVSID
jgi:hypothetical protein